MYNETNIKPRHNISIVSNTMVFTTLVYILFFAALSFYLFSKWRYSYWRRRGLENPEAVLFYGNTRSITKKTGNFADLIVELYKNFKTKGLKHGGMYLFFEPVYIPVDLEIIKCILQKDFAYFPTHGHYVDEKADPLSGHLFNLEGEKWKSLRTKLTPTFTSGKMKMMFPTLIDCTEGLADILNENATMGDAVDIKDVLSRYTTDVIGSCAFGIDCNSLKNPNSEFRKYGDRIFGGTTNEMIKRMIAASVPKIILQKLRFKMYDQELQDFFSNLVKNTVEYREKNNVHRKDFMHLLIQLKNMGHVTDDGTITAPNSKPSDKVGLTINEITAQSFVFFAAGFETSATTMSFALLELALNQDIQEKLRQEIGEMLKKYDGKVTYDSIIEMEYLDKVIDETLRKHSPAIYTSRVCNKNYQVPDTNIVIERGTRVHVPIHAIHRDPEYYPDPEKFDPERFNEANKAKRPAFTYLPFGEGPKICIGLRFGKLQAKVGLISILSNFKVTLHEKTKIPITYAPTFIASVEGGIWLRVSKVYLRS